MAKRFAFLIGNQTFKSDSGLLPLQGPANDVAALARLLGDPERGRFKVYEFFDKSSHEILPDIEQLLGEATVGDFFLIYYSGHGKLDRSGRLCLATADTRQGALVATSIPARQLRDLADQSNCDQILLLLDCCYSGAVEDGLRGDVGDELHVVEDARGFYIVTASTGTQVARETTPALGGVVMGRLTAAVVDGIESGAADLGRKGKILLSDLRRYLGQTVTGQTPQFFDRKASGDPLISLNPATTPPLHAEIMADLDAEQWHRRRGAVSALASVLQDGDALARAAARAALQRRMQQERDYFVRAELKAALDLGSADPQPALRPAVPPNEPSLTRPTIRELLADPESFLFLFILSMWILATLTMWFPFMHFWKENIKITIVFWGDAFGINDAPLRRSSFFIWFLFSSLSGASILHNFDKILKKEQKRFLYILSMTYLTWAMFNLFVDY